MSESQNSICSAYSKRRTAQVESPDPGLVSGPAVTVTTAAAAAAAMKNPDDDAEDAAFRKRSQSSSTYESKFRARSTSRGTRADHPESKALFFANPDSHLGREEKSEEKIQRISRKTSVSEDLVDASEESRIDHAYLPKILRDQCPDGHNIRAAPNEVKVLVLYTGGTIGMTCKNGVYSPEPDFLVRKLRKLPTLHDAEYVRKFMMEGANVDDSGLPLALPMSASGKRIIYVIYEYDPLLDSSNITMVDWIRIANDIKLSYTGYDGFVVLHGTDTMAYTASALSFMLENLGKPVVLTGSQIPIPEMRSDGRDNLLGALYMAGHYCIPEVCLYFNCKLMRGNRTSKVSTNRLDAFDTPNFPPLATLEVDVQVNWDIILQSPPAQFRVHPTLNRHVGILRLFPSISTELVLNYLKPPMAGVILQTYGMGNAPDNREDIIEALREATDRGVIIINISQCPRGEVAATYAVSAALVEAGVIGGGDMTPEAGLAKLSYVLSKDEWPIEKKRLMMSHCLRGEVRVPKASTASNLASAGILSRLSAALNLKGEEEVQYIKKAFIPSLMGTAVKTGDKETLLSLHQELGTFNIPMIDNRTLLHIAAIEGRLDMAAFLLERGASLHVRDAFGRSPLIDAVERKHVGIVKLFRKSGAHLRAPIMTSVASDVAVSSAASAAHPPPPPPPPSESLAAPSCSMPRIGSTFGVQVCLAVWNRDKRLVTCWLIAGVDPNDPDYAGTRPLHVAVRALVRADIVKMLLAYGARTYLSDGNGKTPLELLETVDSDKRTERWKEIHQMLSTWNNDDETHPLGTSLSTLWRLAEGDDEEEVDREDEKEDEENENTNDDTDQALEESLSTDDDLLEVKRRVGFTLSDDVDKSEDDVDDDDGSPKTRKRRDTVREADDEEKSK